MDNKPASSSAFGVLALLTAILLAAALGVLYLQGGGTAGNDGTSDELAALSQALPLHAANAVAGDEQAFARLESALSRFTELRAEGGTELPGGAQPWTDLEQHARAILANRADVLAITDAASFVDERMPQMLEAANPLLEVSGATAHIQQFQQRGIELQQALNSLAAGSEDADGDTLAGDMNGHLAYLRSVADALSGEPTDLDIAPLAAEDRENLLAPVTSELAEIEPRVRQALSAAAGLGDPSANVASMTSVAEALYSAVLAAPETRQEGSPAQRWLPLLLVAISLLLLGVLALMHSRSSVYERASREHAEQNERNQQAILRLLDELGSLADGDLTVEATVTEDITGAIADSINYAIEKLRELVATINETAIMVDSAAKQTENTAGHMARAADNQNREIRAATESIESMAASIEEVSGNAERSSDVARHSVDVAHKGGEAVRRTIDGMNTIRETIQDTSKRIKRLGESSQEIGNIVELINDIAEQTNILALNASIQASMAGEAGRGFAVVADEVQRLAERSTNATKQIEVLVRTIQADTNEAVVSMERSTTDVVGGALLAENAGAALDEIEQVSNQIASLVQNISGSAREQARAAADVTRRTARLKEISDQTGKATSATASAISKLSVLASQLRQTVAGFTLPSSALESSAFAPKKTPPAPEKRKTRAAS
jgi:twitching motility protein PilJ